MEALICLTPYLQVSCHANCPTASTVDATNLHLYVEDNNLPLGRLFLDRCLTSAIAIVAELGMLDEAIFGDEILKVLGRHEVVVGTVDLTGPRASRGMRYGEGIGIWVALEEQVVERSFADPRRTGYD